MANRAISKRWLALGGFIGKSGQGMARAGAANIPILSRAFYSLQDSLAPFKVSIGVALLNIALAIVLAKPLGHGGIALASSLAQLSNMVCLAWLLRKKAGQSHGFLSSLTKIAAASGLMGGVVYLLYHRLAGLG